jgi:hypothetical protein
VVPLEQAVTPTYEPGGLLTLEDVAEAFAKTREDRIIAIHRIRPDWPRANQPKLRPAGNPPPRRFSREQKKAWINYLFRSSMRVWL